MNKDIEKIIEAAKAGGEVLVKYFGESLETTIKRSASDFRTKADVESENVILEVLEREFPDYSIISEEAGAIDKKSDYTFLIDPMDGTNNFVLGIPNFCVSIALFFEEEIIMGVIYVPILDKVYWSEKGKGAYLDGKKLTVNKEKKIENSTVSYVCDYGTDVNMLGERIKKLITKNFKRVMENYASTFDFCMLASGRIESIIFEGAEVYDFAAGKLICREAGAVITDLEGNEDIDINRNFVVSINTTIHKEVLEILK